jgi:hypothetical protein
MRPASPTQRLRSISAANLTGLLLVVATVAFGTGCGTTKDPGTSESSKEPFSELPPCRQYLEMYDGCMRRLTPSPRALAEGRTSAIRKALNSSPDATSAAKTCASGLLQLKTSCP